ncbi:SAM-dependent methyltransferase [Siminovitchia sediminis]|uniref:SAM-dependent methyltransferase n=1 Tax=Siminovitchia sediminis TaxID=1274353 RepID=A0ABW4KCE0_9BACI
MIDYKYDKLLSIRTTGERDAAPSQAHYHPYEPTPYPALEQLFNQYQLKAGDRLVDMGCGKGRVPFYVNYYFQASALGIEMNPALYEEALRNKISYSQKVKRRRGIVDFQCMLAQDYHIHPHDNVFFFFNPFSVQIFMTVVNNIIQSCERHPRTIDVILYYPSNDYLYFLLNQTQFVLLEEIHLEHAYERNHDERIMIFRLNKGGD